jgi:uncharacterized membrane protein YdbT with pleckstrin-like domain
MKDEKILVSFHPHKIIVAAPAALFLIALAFNALGLHYLPALSTVIFKGYSIFSILCFIFYVYTIFKIINRLIEYRTSEYTVTNLRVVMKTGVLNRMALELMLNRLEAITVQQTLLGQIFNYGMVILVGVGGTRDAFNYVPKALYFRQKIQSTRNSENSP